MRSRTNRGAIVALAGVVLLAMGVVAQGVSATEEQVPPAIRLARLSGPVEVPPGDPDGTGLATFIIDPARGQLCFSIVVDDIMLPAIAAHIHVAPAGVAGPIVVPLTPPDANGASAGCVGGIDQQLLRAIKSHPRQYYVNVHTTDFPAARSEDSSTDPERHTSSTCAACGPEPAGRRPPAASRSPRWWRPPCRFTLGDKVEGTPRMEGALG